MLQDEVPRAGAVAIEMDARTSQQLQLIDEQVGTWGGWRGHTHPHPPRKRRGEVGTRRVTREPVAPVPALLAPQDSYIQNRADTMQNIESTIVELGSIFQQLAHMVKEQEETIQRYKHPHPRQSPVRLSPASASVCPFRCLFPFPVPTLPAGSTPAWRTHS